jgi:hypothetical protein
MITRLQENIKFIYKGNLWALSFIFTNYCKQKIPHEEGLFIIAVGVGFEPTRGD